MKQFEPNRKYFTISVYVLTVLVIITLFVKIVFSWEDIGRLLSGFISALSPFLMGFFIAYLLNPFVKILSHKVFRKVCKIKSRTICSVLAILCTYILAFGLFGVVIIFLMPQIARSITDLVTLIPEWIQEIIVGLNDLLEKMKEMLPTVDFTFLDDIVNDNLPQILDVNVITGWISSFVPQFFVTSIGVIKGIFNLLVAIIVSVYMLYDKHTLGSAANRLLHACVSKTRADSITTTAKECNSIFGGFISGKMLDSLIIGVICFVGMSLLRLPYTLLISLIVGITNMIPYFGPWIGAIPGVIIILLISPIQALIYIIFVLILQQFDGLYLGPKILGNSTGLRPMWIIFAITFGGYIGGVIGMFLGVPVVAVLAFLIGRWVDKRLDKKSIDRESLEMRATIEIPPIPKHLIKGEKGEKK